MNFYFGEECMARRGSSGICSCSPLLSFEENEILLYTWRMIDDLSECVLDKFQFFCIFYVRRCCMKMEEKICMFWITYSCYYLLPTMKFIYTFSSSLLLLQKGIFVFMFGYVMMSKKPDRRCEEKKNSSFFFTLSFLWAWLSEVDSMIQVRILSIFWYDSLTIRSYVVM